MNKRKAAGDSLAIQGAKSHWLLLRGDLQILEPILARLMDIATSGTSLIIGHRRGPDHNLTSDE